MNTQLGDTQKVPYTLTALDADGNPASLAAGDVVVVSSSDTASATVVPDATPAAGSLASGFILGGKKLQVGVVITAAANKADGSVDLTVTDTIDIVAGAASALSFGLGAPVSQ